MPINSGSISSTSAPALSNTAAAALCTVPPGNGTVVISNNSGAVVYIAAGVTATTTNGFAVASGATVSIPLYAGSAGTTLSAIAATAPTASAPLSWLISSV